VAALIETGGPARATFAELYAPKLLTVLREGYDLRDFRADALAGLTVAIVALPLSMAIAIGSGTTPERGLYTAIVGGFFVSLLGGSRFQIGGPAGAFIALVALSVARVGIDGLVLATILSGLMLAAGGFLRLGTYIKFIPYPVTVGFTAGIAAIIFASQLHDLFGFSLTAPEPAAFMPKIATLLTHAHTINAYAVAIALGTIAIITGLNRIRPTWPGFLIAIAAASFAAALFHLPVETIQSHFGGIPRSLPLPHLPAITLDRIALVLPDAIAFTLLGSIESLLSASVADGMTGRRHRSNCELVAQGAANVASGLFGGICVTGTIARTATNIRAGARGPISGMLHSAYLLLFMLAAAPLAGYIPLAALAGVLGVVAWNMIEKQALLTLLKSARGDALVVLTTLLLTIFRDLTSGIIVGFSIGTLLFLNRMSKTITVETHTPMVPDDQADSANGGRTRYDTSLATDQSRVIYRISGAFFFGSASIVAAVLDRIAERPKVFVLDFAAAPYLDSTAAITIAGFARKMQRNSTRLIITGAIATVRRELALQGVAPPQVEFMDSIEEAQSRTNHKPVSPPE
jgi:SulP family sulfate permease